MALPTFLTIGGEKCGTTSLHGMLARHPDVSMSEPKEPSFFLSKDPRYIGQDLGDLPHDYISSRNVYESIFPGADGARAIGESSPCYLYSAVAATRIAATVPEAKIIVLLRDPAERAFSQFSYNQQNGWELRSRSFQEALALESERVEANAMWAFHYTRRGMYWEQLQPYLELFGDRLRAWSFDDLKAKPGEVLSQVCRFLEVDEIEPDPGETRQNVTALPRSLLVRRLLDRPNRLKAALGKILPTPARRAVGAVLRRWNARPPERDDDAIEGLRSVFEGDIRRLSESVLPSASTWLT